MDETIAEIKRRIEEKRAAFAPGDERALPRGGGGRRDPLATAERARREATAFGLDLALQIIDETVR
jgi:hypothetical protein